ncbi:MULTISPECIES: NUDIX domain-containing protein [Pseudomonas]|uniref:NUDIX domain-containing protein n=1 Tax=Pseudomonas TaxID=286 RepID=UPI002A91E4B6|nr:NUDIX domain-containing protein [Pseudomonas putida]
MNQSRELHSTVICLQADEVLLVRKESTEWSLPGGKIDPGQTQIEAARRQLDEETAYRSAKLSSWAIMCLKRKSTGCTGLLYPAPGSPTLHAKKLSVAGSRFLSSTKLR